ncbi:hypothetical protein LY76DRAFT_606974 [Colletotrichum caudatum]|nr:hypothetical protein LY76DRAFT_606974 [Colletotrichum caudatum]
MLFTVYSSILLSFLGSAALAANVNRDNPPARDQCTTQYGGSSVNCSNSITTTTTTLSTGTVVPTPSGFRPASDTIPGPNMSYKKRSLSNISPVHRALDPASFDITPIENAAPLVKFKTRRQKRTNKQYPSKVESLVTERGPSVAVTVTVTVSSLVVLTPTITATVITTSTETVTTFTATEYAACASGTGNLVYTARDDNAIIPRVIPNGLIGQPPFTVASPSQCCSRCFADPQCAVSSFDLGYAELQCTLYYTPTVEACSAPDSFSAGVLVLPTPVPFLAVSNGRCGQFNYVVGA